LFAHDVGNARKAERKDADKSFDVRADKQLGT
jgi:hypothetical protein